MLKTHKAIVDKIVSYVLPPILPVAAALIILLQQIYYPEADVAAVFNIMLLLMSLIEFLPLAINRKDKQPCLLVCNIALLLGAFLYNVFLAGIPSPLENLTAFFNSICGVWVVVAGLEIAFFIIPIVLVRLREREDVYQSEAGTTPRENPPSENNHTAQENPSHQMPKTSTKPKKKEAETAQINSKKPSHLAAIIIIAITLGMPFIGLDFLSPWFERVKELVDAVYGPELGSASALLTIILYVVMMAALALLLWVIYWVIYYSTAQILTKPTDVSGILEEYSAPAAIFIVALVVIYAFNSTSQDDKFNVETFGKIIELMMLIIVGIIGLLVLFEVLRLVINQCLKKGSLLKTAMDLVFVLVIQYTTNFITGILRAFAIKDVIESILLFFMPDLNMKIGAKVDQVFNKALEKEVRDLDDELSKCNQIEAEKENAKSARPGMRTTTPIRRRESDEK